MQLVISKIQKEGVVWLQDHVLRTYRPSPTDFIHALHKVYIFIIIITVIPLPFLFQHRSKHHRIINNIIKNNFYLSP